MAFWAREFLNTDVMLTGVTVIGAIGLAQHTADQGRYAQQQREQQLEPEALARKRPDPRKKTRGGRRDDRDVVPLGLRRLWIVVPGLIDR